MNNRPNDILLLIGKIICIFMQAALVIGAIALTIAIPVVLIFGSSATGAGGLPADFPLWALAAVMAVGLIIVALMFGFFDRLRRIIGTVGQGDPFQPENATRLSQMGWLIVGAQLMVIPAGILAAVIAPFADKMDNVHFTIDGGFDAEGILLAIVLFILARVFRHGAAMRDDLEGTV
ncbi:DUF2975 domain-containing protein [Tsuneonella suprasediminis]|uniref:DUF2975 domain-containing protein n=1 Tax=Tsuneonella suprasediminis TaxID=2306996 RepID=A0A419R1D8_9SPHN|nr:DUF2975 domain-containing protein [Tsuneonella suprasediminis]RJX67767.1 DUF2975 domain-containing protein [Tsuneonella suprasediminis]UBS33289.1 DUF2975 domain-containing protein [Altererythrobacter sp. N1]